MDTKDELVNGIKEWIKYDNEIREMRIQMKSKNAAKKALTEKLLDVMQTNEVDLLQTNDLELRCVKRQTKETLSQKFLETMLSKYFDDPLKATDVNTFLQTNRKVTTKNVLQTKRIMA